MAILNQGIHMRLPDTTRSTFDKSKDLCYKFWVYKNNRETLEAGVYTYGGGKVKFQIGPRKYNDKIVKVGRLTVDEVVWMASILDEAMELMDEIEEKFEPS